MEDDNDDREDDDDRGSGNDQAESVNSPAAGNDKGARDLCGRRQGEGDVGFGEEVNDEGLGFRGPSRFRRTPNPDRTAPVTGVISHHKIVWTSKNEIGANPKL